MSMKNKHWFEGLFQENFLEECNSDCKMRTHATASGIAPLDISTIKHIYEKALLISKLEEEQNNDLDFEIVSKLDNLPNFELPSFESITAGKLESLNNGAASISNGINNASQSNNQICDGKQDNVWSPTEVQTLRQYYIRTREENSRLRLLLNVREEELSLLREKYKIQESELNQTRADLQDTQRSKDRATSGTTREDYKHSQLHNRVETLEQDLKYCQEGRSRLAKEVLRLEKDFNLEREARAKLESSLHGIIQENQRDILFLEENWKSLHKNEVARLKRVIDELNHRLTREEEIRRCVQLGLDSLQRHFTRTSPPSEGHHTPTKINKLNTGTVGK